MGKIENPNILPTIAAIYCGRVLLGFEVLESAIIAGLANTY